MLTLPIILFVLFLGLSAFFSSSETAITSISKLHVEKLLEGGRKDSPLSLWLKDPNRILATLLVGNNIANVGASIVAAYIAAQVFPEDKGLAGFVAFTGTTGTLLIFGEIIPKIVAKMHFEAIAPRVIRPLNLLHFPFAPIIWVCLSLSNLVIRLLGGGPNRKAPFMTEDDVKLMIEVSEREGVLEEDEREMIHSIIEFGDTIAKEVMVPRTDMIRLQAGASLKESLRVTVAAGHSRIPVYEDRIDNIVGILYAKDLLAYWHKMHQAADGGAVHSDLNGLEKDFNLKQLLREPTYVPETKKLSELLKEFQQERTHIAIVVDEYGGTAGLVTIEDVLEEIVGEIRDEHDVEGERYRTVGENRWEIDGRMTLSDLEYELEIELPEGQDFETVSGLVSAITGRVPEVGESMEYEGYRLTVLDGDERHVKRVCLERLEEPKASKPLDAESSDR